MITGIANRNLFQWVIDDKIVGIAQLQYEQFDIPVLGFVYTHPDFRGQGIGSSIAFQVTQGLLNHGHERVRLMTDAGNPSSNRAFQKVGYVIDGEYVVRYKEQ
jgi:predicted GNAT family acetyltransferase